MDSLLSNKQITKEWKRIQREHPEEFALLMNRKDDFRRVQKRITRLVSVPYKRTPEQ